MTIHDKPKITNAYSFGKVRYKCIVRLHMRGEVFIMKKYYSQQAIWTSKRHWNSKECFWLQNFDIDQGWNNIESLIFRLEKNKQIFKKSTSIFVVSMPEFWYTCWVNMTYTKAPTTSCTSILHIFKCKKLLYNYHVSSNINLHL